MTAALLRARDYAKAYGWLAGAVEQFLRGEIAESELLRLTGEAEAIAQGTRVTQGGKRRGSKR